MRTTHLVGMVIDWVDVTMRWLFLEVLNQQCWLVSVFSALPSGLLFPLFSPLAKKAAIQRGMATPIATPTTTSSLTLSPPTLESMCMHVLVLQSTKYGMPSCSSLSPLLAQKLMAALRQEKRLNS